MRARPSILRRIARLALRLLGLPLAAVALRLLRLTGRRAGVAVVYHTVGERTGDPATELVPPHGLDLFAAQIRHLGRKYAVVPAADLQAAAAARKRGARFPAAITFDDDLAEHVQFALPVLERHGATATFFLTGATLDRPYSFWWERLQRAVDRGAPLRAPGETEAHAVGRTEIRRIGWAVEWLDPAERARWADELAAAAGPDPADAGLRRDGVRGLVAAGMTIGFHTRRHDRMPPLDDESLAASLRDGRAELEALTGAPMKVIGYPHGGADERVALSAREAGFAIGYTTQVVAVGPTSNPLLLGRLNPSYRSAGHFALQLVRLLATAHR